MFWPATAAASRWAARLVLDCERIESRSGIGQTTRLTVFDARATAAAAGHAAAIVGGGARAERAQVGAHERQRPLPQRAVQIVELGQRGRERAHLGERLREPLGRVRRDAAQAVDRDLGKTVDARDLGQLRRELRLLLVHEHVPLGARGGAAHEPLDVHRANQHALGARALDLGVQGVADLVGDGYGVFEVIHQSSIGGCVDFGSVLEEAADARRPPRPAGSRRRRATGRGDSRRRARVPPGR